MIAYIIFGVILLLITLYIIVYVIYPSSGNNDVLSKMTDLNTATEVLATDLTQSTLLSSAGSTTMGFFYLDSGDRTVKFANSFTPLMQVANNWYLEISPAPVGADKVSVQLRVQTNDANTLKQETIPLPPIPKQKWVFIAILRDGRRFDVIYDNKIVASHRLEFYPVIISSPLTVGGTGLSGKVIHVMVNGTRLNPYDIERERVAHVDTNNMVLEANQIDTSLPGLKLFARCPPGLPCDPITVPPQNNLVQWNTPYA
jgi:hypothetical protein